MPRDPLGFQDCAFRRARTLPTTPTRRVTARGARRRRGDGRERVRVLVAGDAEKLRDHGVLALVDERAEELFFAREVRRSRPW